MNTIHNQALLNQGLKIWKWKVFWIVEQTNELPNQIKSIAYTYVFFNVDRGGTINTLAFPVPSRRNDPTEKDLE